MNLIVVSSLSCDEGLYFRYITMIAQQELDYDVLLEAKKEDVDYYFKLLKKSSDDLNLKELSMGMSSDFENALINGSTFLRLGTLIMGERNIT